MIGIRTRIAVMVILAVVAISGCQNGLTGTRGRPMRVILQAAPRNGDWWPIQPSSRRDLMEQDRQVIENRAKGSAGAAEVDVTVDGNDKLVLTVTPAPKNPATILKGLTSTATLEFYYLKDVRNDITNPKGKWKIEAPMTKNGAYIFTGPRGETIDSIKQPRQVLDKVVGAATNLPVLTGRDLLPNARASISSRNKIVLDIEFGREGTQIFRKFTSRHVDDYLAIFFDGRLLTAPTITEAIPWGKAEISGFRSLTEARKTAEYLNAGVLPIPLKIVPK